VSSLTGSRRTYVARSGALRRRLDAVSVRLPFDPGAALTTGTALAVVLAAFTAKSGPRLAQTTWTEIGLMLAGSGLCAIALVRPRAPGAPARLRGGWLLVVFGLLAVFTALSITWSLTPGTSYLEANRTLAYLATLAGGIALGRLAPARWGAMLAGVALSAIVICVWALLTKVFPGALAPDEQFARLRPPFDYWNSTGLAAALGLFPLLWLAVRRSGHAAVNVLAWPGLGLLTVVLLLSYSRGALIAVGLGLALWLAIVPLRLRSVVVLGAVVLTTLPLLAWAFAQDGLTLDQAPLALRIDAGDALGALLVLLVTALLVAGLAVGFLSAHRPPGAVTRQRASRILVVALAVVPAIAILMLANAPGGISGQVSKAWHHAIDPTADTPANSPSRLTETASVRSRYWREALSIHAQSPGVGTGAGSYNTVRLRYRTDTLVVQHAHGYVVQTLADLGWAGLALSLMAALVWLVAAARVLGLRPSDRGLPWDPERVGVATLALVVLVFGFHSALDWTWFVPGNAIPALLCAGWVASRVPLRERLATAPAPAPRSPVRLRAAAAAGVVAIGLVASWGVLQPLRSANAEDAAFERVDQGALPQALSIARIAHDRDPLALSPLFDIAAIEQSRGNRAQAQLALEQAVRLEPATPEAWRRLARFRLDVLHNPKSALSAFQTVFVLDPASLQSQSDVLTTSRLVQSG
jgi:hypothetical protein